MNTAEPMTYWVYVLASRRHGTLYVGVTSELQRRVEQHRSKQTPGFTSRYDVTRLVYFTGFGDVRDAIYFEKRLKRWRRDWKIRLIEAENPFWEDLYVKLLAPASEPPCAWVPDSRSAASGMTVKARWSLRL
jgi:putative endonuclease